ncbi:MAG: MBL fold metallo-hydrolase [Myxococcales bacterium]|nr:MBL fold metallo-hydrolase [Myxococcales bacterium]MCB9704352.1 MBL fold metallo-hydrolase [Myxococcales bacterium]
MWRTARRWLGLRWLRSRAIGEAALYGIADLRARLVCAAALCFVCGVLELVQIEVGLVDNFSTLIGEARAGAGAAGVAAIVDPAFEGDRILRLAAARGWRIAAVLVTHGHDDHVEAVAEVAAATGAAVYAHPLEVARLRELCGERGVPGERVIAVADGQEISIGGDRVQAIFAPGHAPGCVCWFVPSAPALCTGDVLFVGSCGSASDPIAYVDTLQRRIAALPEMTRIYPGHDYGETPTSTLAWELSANPALLAMSVAEFCTYKGISPPRAGR